MVYAQCTCVCVFVCLPLCVHGGKKRILGILLYHFVPYDLDAESLIEL